MNGDMPYVGSFSVTVADTDRHDKLKYSSLCSLLQECTRHHADRMGLGYQTLLANGQTWMLRHMRIELTRRPRSGESISIHTWSRGCEGLRAFRDFRIEDARGQTIGAASSEWILLDMARQRPCLPGKIFPQLKDVRGSCPLKTPMAELGDPVRIWPLDSRKVRFSDLDFNGHVNNARYVSWIEDTLGSFLHAERELAAVELCFVSGARLDDAVEVLGTHAPWCRHGMPPVDMVGEPEIQYLCIRTPPESTLPAGMSPGTTLARARVAWA